MAMARMSKVRLGLVLALVSATASLGLLVSGSSPVAADVTATSGSAFGISATLLNLPIIAPTPVVNGGPQIGFAPQTQSTLSAGVPFPAVCPVNPNADLVVPPLIPGLPPVVIPNVGNVPVGNIVEACAINVSTQGVQNPDPHLNAVTSTAEIGGAAVGSGPKGLLTVGAVTAACRADGDVATGSATVADLTLGGAPLALVGPLGPNTAVVVPGTLSVVLNEQIPAIDPNTIGINTITVNAVHVTLLDNTEIILGHVVCTATGPDVNNVGDIEVDKVAPADAQASTFTFTITCPGVTGSPFTRTVTGTGTTAPVQNVLAGTVCTVAETTLPGFVAQPNQNVTSIRDTIQAVTFTNTRTVVPVQTGSVQVVKVAPADAQGVTFTFSISCPGVVGSPFTRTVIGSASTLAMSGIPEGTVCTAAETPLAGFNVQPNQTFQPVLAGATRQVTFTNTRVAGPVGSVVVNKVAPADAQNLTFTFSISCPGAVGSPFVRSITGSGASAPVPNVATGIVCTAAEVPTAGFIDLPAQTFAPVATGLTQMVTFTNVRSATNTTGSVAVAKVAPADAQNIDFTFTIACPGAAGSPFVRTVTGSNTSIPVSGLAAGTVCTVSETPTAGFIDQLSQDTAPVITGGTRTVTFTNTRSAVNTGSVRILKEAPADAQGVAFTFAIACPGVPGSPFVRSVTGSNATVPVSNIPAGTVCTASEARTAGFADQAARPLPAVIVAATQGVTFVNTRVIVPPPPVVPQRPPSLPRTGANIQRLVALGGLALFLGSLLTLGGRSPGMLGVLGRNVAKSIRPRRRHGR